MSQESPTQEQVEEFNKDLQALLAKHSLNMGSEAFILDGKIASKVVVSLAPQPIRADKPEDNDSEKK